MILAINEHCWINTDNISTVYDDDGAQVLTVLFTGAQVTSCDTCRLRGEERAAVLRWLASAQTSC